MRILIDTLVAIMVLGLLGGVVIHQADSKNLEREKRATREAVRSMQSQIRLHAALHSEGHASLQFPTDIQASWFGETVPINRLLEEQHPWLEIASEGDRHLRHPVHGVASQNSQAGFWYNPYLGVVRGRVPGNISDRESLELYNFINDTDRSSLLPSSK